MSEYITLPDEEIEFLEQSNFIEGVIGGLNEAVQAWHFLLQEDVLTTRLIRETHQILMRNQRTIDDLDKGRFRIEDVYIGEFKKENFAPHWATVPASMEELVAAINSSLQSKYLGSDDLKKGTVLALHVMFEKIHPFLDGNGRVGRIVMNWHLKKFGLPVLIIREEKEQYYNWFRHKYINIKAE